MSNKVTLCNSNGESLCGSDGHITTDGRLNLFNTTLRVRHYRERFRKHLEYQANFWTHFYFDRQPGKLYPIDSTLCR